jgi:hypothetical protein
MSLSEHNLKQFGCAILTVIQNNKTSNLKFTQYDKEVDDYVKNLVNSRHPDYSTWWDVVSGLWDLSLNNILCKINTKAAY